MVRWDGILFDLDGTLLDTSEGVLKAIDDTLGEMHLTMPAGMERTDLIGPPIYDSFRDIFHLSSQEAEIAAGIFRNAYKEKYLFIAPFRHSLFIKSGTIIFLNIFYYNL